MIISAHQSAKHFKVLKEILGKEYFKQDIQSSYDFILVANKGLLANAIGNFREHFKLSRAVVAEMLNISEPTVYRWIKGNKSLERNYTIQLLELTNLFLIGIDVFQSQENFFKWLNLPNTALGGMKPLDFLEIPNGLSKVRDLLGRIEHGVYS